MTKYKEQLATRGERRGNEREIMKTKVAFICGVPPTCHNCANDAKVQLGIPSFAQPVNLCEDCLIKFVEEALGRIPVFEVGNWQA